MSTKRITSITAGFESLKQTNEHNTEYWCARDLQPLLGYYAQWCRFEQAVERAMTSCDASGNQASHHFAGAGKPIMGGKGAVQVVDDYHLSRFACYLIPQNGPPRERPTRWRAVSSVRYKPCERMKKTPPQTDRQPVRCQWFVSQIEEAVVNPIYGILHEIEGLELPAPSVNDSAWEQSWM
ncbi:MAG: hypothetical protein Q8R67_21705 [Rhodoferax sp.]|nr:hypothetical protein [Rhodoferax sp.]MDP3654292.1 hypothetical protein [Rhodoferax sp.]